MNNDIKELRKRFKALTDTFPLLNQYEALSIIVQMQRNEILMRAETVEGSKIAEALERKERVTERSTTTETREGASNL